MRTPPRHLIPPLMFPGVRVRLLFTVNFSIYLNLTLILTADFSVYVTRRADFDNGLFRLPNLVTPFLTTDFYV
jgi:hypothetical protein